MFPSPLNPLLSFLCTFLRLDCTLSGWNSLACTLDLIFWLFFNSTCLKSWVVTVWGRTWTMIMLVGVWNGLEVVPKIRRGIMITKHQKKNRTRPLHWLRNSAWDVSEKSNMRRTPKFLNDFWILRPGQSKNLNSLVLTNKSQPKIKTAFLKKKKKSAT